MRSSYLLPCRLLFLITQDTQAVPKWKPGDLVRFKETIYYDNQHITDAIAMVISRDTSIIDSCKVLMYGRITSWHTSLLEVIDES